MATRSALNKIIGSQHVDRTIRTARVPFRDDGLPQTGRISEGKRKYLETLLNKEKNKEKLERVSLVLTKKLAAKYGSKYEVIISFFVEEYFGAHEDISPQDLDLLEREIRNAIRLKIDAAEQERKSTMQTQSNKETKPNVEPPPSDQNSLTRPPSGNSWQLLQAYQVVQDEEQIRREKEKARESKMKFKAALDEHVSIASKASQRRNIDDIAYAEQVRADVEKFNEEQRRKEEEKRLQHHAELVMRKQQIEEQRKRMQDEKDELRRIEERNIQIARAELEKEAEKMRLHKLSEKEAHAKIRRENELNKKMQTEEKLREIERDHQLMLENQKRLDREAAEREAAFQNRMKMMEKHALKFENEGAGKAQREEQLRFEQMLLKEQRKKEEEDHRKEVEKEEQRRKRLQEQLAENKRQLEKKQQDLEREREEDHQLRERYRREVNDYQSHEKQLRKKRLQDQAAYRSKLDQQVEELSKVDRNLVGITPTEKKLNMTALRDLSQDPQVLSKVMHQLRIGGATNKK